MAALRHFFFKALWVFMAAEFTTGSCYPILENYDNKLSFYSTRNILTISSFTQWRPPINIKSTIHRKCLFIYHPVGHFLCFYYLILINTVWSVFIYWEDGPNFSENLVFLLSLQITDCGPVKHSSQHRSQTKTLGSCLKHQTVHFSTFKKTGLHRVNK